MMKNKKILLSAILIVFIACIITFITFFGLISSGAPCLRLSLRTRSETFNGSGVWKEMVSQEKFLVNETAIIIVDMWDRHWCRGMTERVGEMAPVMNSVVESARENGVQIIHAPSDTMDYYKDYPQRARIKNFPSMDVPPPQPNVPPLPVDASDGGCDTPGDHSQIVWKSQHPSIEIKEEDVISDDGREIHGFMKQKGIKNLIIMGVATNMCILDRPFAIKRMSTLGFRVVLVRDLTDSMYNPEMPPHVSHEEGTRLVVEYIEKYWCPSILSEDLLNVYRGR